ncbi:NUDIX hydrolase [bacterium]|jgi:ADP-ribose pyrophosphatase YjhB (NUDIX family)|nr:NUDIX hydrolase [bacterium]
MATDNDPLKFAKRVPDGDSRERLVCGDCGWIHYENPKIIVGAVCTWQDKFLLCRRAIEPRIGFWTMPAGFMEEGETAEEGAAREAMEEACAPIEIDRLLAIYSVPRISQVHLIYRARLKEPTFDVGPESAEVKLLAWDDIPWTDLAFPTVHWALAHFREVAHREEFSPFVTPPQAIENMRRHPRPHH